jgi:hypothetical protein
MENELLDQDGFYTAVQMELTGYSTDHIENVSSVEGVDCELFTIALDNPETRGARGVDFFVDKFIQGHVIDVSKNLQISIELGILTVKVPYKSTRVDVGFDVV